MKDKLTNGEKSIAEEQLAHQEDQEQWDLHLLNILYHYITCIQIN